MTLTAHAQQKGYSPPVPPPVRGAPVDAGSPPSPVALPTDHQASTNRQAILAALEVQEAERAVRETRHRAQLENAVRWNEYSDALAAVADTEAARHRHATEGANADANHHAAPTASESIVTSKTKPAAKSSSKSKPDKSDHEEETHSPAL